MAAHQVTVVGVCTVSMLTTTARGSFGVRLSHFRPWLKIISSLERRAFSSVRFCSIVLSCPWTVFSPACAARVWACASSQLPL